MAKRQIAGWAGKDWELTGYAWRGDCEKSALTGKQIRPVVAVDSEGKFHSGVRNREHDGKRRETLYHHQATPHRTEAVALAQWMSRQCVADHRELAADIERYRQKRNSAAERFGMKGEHSLHEHAPKLKR